MRMRTHLYAENAYPKVEAIKNDPIGAKYRTLALSFPALIMQGGLAQAIGFLMAKNEAEHKTYLQHLVELLDNGNPDYKIFHQRILRSDIHEYQLLSRKALDASAWLKRYTQALLEKTE